MSLVVVMCWLVVSCTVLPSADGESDVYYDYGDFEPDPVNTETLMVDNKDEVNNFK